MKKLILASLCALLVNATAGWFLSATLFASEPEKRVEAAFVVINPPADFAERVNLIGFFAGEKSSLAELAVEMQTVYAPRVYSQAEAHALLRKNFPDLSFDLEELAWSPASR